MKAIVCSQGRYWTGLAWSDAPGGAFAYPTQCAAVKAATTLASIHVRDCNVVTIHDAPSLALSEAQVNAARLYEAALAVVALATIYDRETLQIALATLQPAADGATDREATIHAAIVAYWRACEAES